MISAECRSFFPCLQRRHFVLLGDDPGGIPYTHTLSLVGYPAAVVRRPHLVRGAADRSSGRSGPWREDLALAAAAIIERALGG